MYLLQVELLLKRMTRKQNSFLNEIFSKRGIMTKQQVEQKIKEILMKDKRFIGATIEIKFKDKKKKSN